jgi:hypothetical protein
MRILPEIINSTEYQKIGGLVQVLDAGEIGPPFIKFRMGYGNSINIEFINQRMFFAPQPIRVKLLFQKLVHSTVKVERETRGPAGAKTPVYIKTAGTFHEQLDLAPADLERGG